MNIDNNPMDDQGVAESLWGEFGIEKSTGATEAGVKEQEAAEPAPATDSKGKEGKSLGQGENEQEAAEPAEEAETDNNKDENYFSDEADLAQAGKQKGNPYAAARREKERQEREAKIRAEAEDQVIRNLQLTDPYTGKTIQGIADYQEYQKRYQEEKQQQQDNNQDTTETADDISNHPLIKQMQEALAAEQQKEQQKQQQKLRAIVQSETEAIRAIAKESGLPEIETLQDLETMPRFDLFRQLVDSGVGLVEAYKYINKEAICKAAVNKQGEAERLRQKSKSHLQSSRNTGAGSDVVVTEDDIKRYRNFSTDISKEAIKKYKKQEMQAKRNAR